MTRRISGGKLVVASHNAGKVREIADLLASFALEVVSAGELGLDEPEETGRTFAANAALKAMAAARAAGLPALADDSGLVVPALDGAPGIHSARWAEVEGRRDFTHAMGRVHEALAQQSAGPWRAHFTCALCLAWPDGKTVAVEGRIEGRLVWPPRGTRGFGYDPMFEPAGHAQTFGELDPVVKHAISHRADAFKKLIGACFG